MSNESLDWSIWCDTFQEIDESLSIAELHGLMMGIVSVTQTPNAEQWRQILALLKVPSLNDEAIEFLCQETEDASHALVDGELDYLPVLPDDDTPLFERVQALSDWCSGVVLGFGLVAQKLSDDEAEQIEILQDIAAVEFAETDDDEEGEQAYQELYELVRLIPVHLAMGRPNKIAIDESVALNKVPTKNVDVVEVFNPSRPS